MDGRPFTHLERAARDRQRELIAEATRHALVRRARPRPRRTWRAAVAALGRALVGFGSRLESLEGPRGTGRLPALR